MRPGPEFYAGDCTAVAPALVGKLLCRRLPDGTLYRLRITETEAYRGVEDTACHAHRGLTPRTEVLYRGPGTIYIYLCYGIHWLLNIVTGSVGEPQAVLIRGCESAEGPGRLTKRLGLDGSFNRRSILDNGPLWVEDDGQTFPIAADRRVGIGYASKEDQARLWRFILKRE
jgi:DNA-3-methyladenine glycosylase